MQAVAAQIPISTFQLSSIFVSNWTVKNDTYLNYQLQISRDTRIQVQDGDYLVITIPTDTDAQWNLTKKPICEVVLAKEPLDCEILTSKEAIITFQAQSNLVIQGSVSNFINPSSIKQIFNIQASLYNKRKHLLIQDSSLALRSFVPANLKVELISSSPIIGDKMLTLTVQVEPLTPMTARGFVIITIPEYYQDAGQDTLISASNPDPCSSKDAEILSCKFSNRLRQLTIQYRFRDQQNRMKPIHFTVGQFNNPIVQVLSGFEVQILDQDDYLVSKTIDLKLFGITQAAKFASWDFNFIDTAASGQYATHQFIIESSMPIAKGCRFKIIYPPEYTVDRQLTSIQGSGFFQPLGGQVEFTHSETTNSVEIIGCRVNYGIFTSGIIILRSVLNQQFVKTSESFQLLMTEFSDVTYSKVYQKLTTGFIIPDTQQRPGDMKGLMWAESRLVQTHTGLYFQLRPSMNLSKRAYFVINIPNSLKFQGPSCTVQNMRGGFSNKMYCSRVQFQATLSNPFDFDFEAKSADVLYFQLEEFLMPTSVQNIGIVQVISYDYDLNNETRAIDMFEATDFVSQSGNVYKLAEVLPESTETSKTSQTYFFEFQFSHIVPVGGFFRILLDDYKNNQVKITDPKSFNQNCFLIRGQLELGLDCQAGVNNDELEIIDIKCTAAVFGEKGTPKDFKMKIKITGLTNPRIRNELSVFRIFSLDSQLRIIDQNMESDQFTVKMDRVKLIKNVNIDMVNQTNGAQTAYIFQIVPDTVIQTDDIVQIKFPEEMVLPLEMNCQPFNRFVERVACIKLEGNIVNVQLTRIFREYTVGQEIAFQVLGVRNAVSLRPSSPFGAVKIYDSKTMNEISESVGTVIVQNKEISNLDALNAKIMQSSYEKLAENDITLQFRTNNPLPPSTTIQLTVPSTLPRLFTEPSTCYLKLNGKKVEDVCEFKKYDIIFRRGLAGLTIPFVGILELVFRVQNPKDNQFIGDSAFKIIIYDSETMDFGVDKLFDTLYPNIDCEYPCNTCSPSDRKYCLTCLPQLSAPQFLQLYGVDRQTCIDSCPPGFTSNGTKNPRKCVKCDYTCKTCAQDDLPGDVELCTECKPEFPFFWIDKQSCHSMDCPNESYLNNTLRCRSCEAPCLYCSDRITCTKCDSQSNARFLHQGNCMNECPSGYTPVDNVCIQCQSPCSTCSLGEIQSCTSCDNTGERQFLYGRSCVTECPINTTLSLKNMECKGCQIGCALCDENDNSLCLRCSQGLSMYENTCVKVCPFNYLKSADGLTCERRTYDLDRTFIVFPILGTALFFCLITLASYWLTARRSLISSTLIAFFGPIEMAACLYQFIYSNQEEKNFLPIKVGSICVFASGVALNLVFATSFHKQIIKEGKDKEFERWRKNKWCSTKFFFVLAATVSLTLYRLIFCRLFRIQIMSVKVSKTQRFYRPLLIFTCIKLVIFNLPLVAVDIYGISYLSWGNQCFMTMLESMTLSFMSMLLLLLEYKNRNSLFDREDVGINLDKLEHNKSDIFDKFNPFKRKNNQGHKGYAVMPEDSLHYGMRPDVPIDLKHTSLGAIKYALQNNVSMQEIKEADQREPHSPRTKELKIKRMMGIVKQVRQNQDFLLNGHLDSLLLEMFKLKLNKWNFDKTKLRRTQSMAVQRTKLISAELEDVKVEQSQISSKSFPGFNLNEDELRNKFEDHIWQLKKQQLDKNNKNEQTIVVIEDNVYADAVEPVQQVQQAEAEVQTEQEKIQKDQLKKQLEEIRSKIRDNIQPDLIQFLKEIKDDNARKQVKFKNKRGGKKSVYNFPIDEEPDSGAEINQNATNTIPTMDHDHIMPQDMMTLAMQVEQEKSLTSFYDIDQFEKERSQLNASDPKEHLLRRTAEYLIRGLPMMEQPQGILESFAISGNLDSIELSDSDQPLENNPEAQAAAEEKQRVKKEHVQAWIKSNSEKPTIRQFNINDIMGKFKRDWDGSIKGQIQRQFKGTNIFHDEDGNIVNEKGYLMDPDTGDIRSRYTFETVFKKHELIGQNQSEVPLPYRIEKFNFNPHECMGYFDYEQNGNHIPIKDQFNNLLDKFMRRVNSAGWLIDQAGNIVDNQGHVKFVKEQLKNGVDIPKLFNYEGNEYKIKQIMGIFDRDKNSKEIILCQDSRQRFVSCDTLGRRVNSRGYLLDSKGNIIDRQGTVVWMSHQLQYNEPPKLFEFTEFWIGWIRGHTTVDVQKNLKEFLVQTGQMSQGRLEELKDMKGRRINCSGYLIDSQYNIIDIYKGNIIFKKQVLKRKNNQEAQIPTIFRNGKLKVPVLEAIEQTWQQMFERIGGMENAMENIDYFRNMDIDDQDVDRELNRELYSTGQGLNAPFRDLRKIAAGPDDLAGIFGDEEIIPMSQEQAAYLDKFDEDATPDPDPWGQNKQNQIGSGLGNTLSRPTTAKPLAKLQKQKEKPQQTKPRGNSAVRNQEMPSPVKKNNFV